MSRLCEAFGHHTPVQLVGGRYEELYLNCQKHTQGPTRAPISRKRY